MLNSSCKADLIKSPTLQDQAPVQFWLISIVLEMLTEFVAHLASDSRYRTFLSHTAKVGMIKGMY